MNILESRNKYTSNMFECVGAKMKYKQTKYSENVLFYEISVSFGFNNHFQGWVNDVECFI